MTRCTTCGVARASIKCHQALQNDKLDLSLCLGWSQPLSFATYPWRAGLSQPTIVVSALPDYPSSRLIVLIVFPAVNAISHCKANTHDCFEQANGCLRTIESGRSLLWRALSYQLLLLSHYSQARCWRLQRGDPGKRSQAKIELLHFLWFINNLLSLSLSWARFVI